MKNIIKIVSSALVAILALGTVAFASIEQVMGPSIESSAPSTGPGGSTAGHSAPSTGPGGSTAGHTAPSTGPGGSTAGTNTSNGGSNNGGSVASNGGPVGHTSNGATSRMNLAITNVKVKTVGNIATVTWDTDSLAQGMIVYGPVSTTPKNASFYGYSSGTTLTSPTLKHSHTFTMAPGVTYFVRPVSSIASVYVVFGNEVKVNRNIAVAPATVINTDNTAAVSVVLDNVSSTESPIVNVTPVTTTVKKTNFLKRVWNSITAPFCR